MSRNLVIVFSLALALVLSASEMAKAGSSGGDRAQSNPGASCEGNRGCPTGGKPWLNSGPDTPSLGPAGMMGLRSEIGFVPPRVAGRTGVPMVQWDQPGINAMLTAGPYPRATVSGTGYGSPVFLGNGAAFHSMTDFDLPQYGLDWFHVRMFSSLNTTGKNWQGENWWSNEMAYITVSGTDGASDVTVQLDPHYTLSYAWDSDLSHYDDEANYFPFKKIAYSSGNHDYTLTRIDGWLWVFNDSGATNANKLKRIEDPYGNKWTFTYASSKLSDITVDVVEGNDHKITYSYLSDGINDGKVQYIKVYKTTTTTDANLIGQMEYVYHGSTGDAAGSLGDLTKAIVSRKGTNDGDGVLSIEETYRYRYYRGTWDTGNRGVDHQLHYVLLPENATHVTSPDTAANAWTNYENVIYEYENGSGRVTKTSERLPGSGCGCGGGATGTTTYTWTINGGTPDYNTWKTHCVADRNDSSRVIFDVNRLYGFLNWVVEDENDGSPNHKLIWHFEYGTATTTQNRLLAAYFPSACSAYDEGTYATTLRSSDGLVYKIEYFTGVTYPRWPKKIRVQKGSSGTPDTLIEYGRTDSSRPDLATSMIYYESGSEGNGRMTSLSYTFYDGSHYQLKELDITHPSVGSGNNGPASSAVTKQFFDKRTGQLRWTLDGEGYVNFYAYDTDTGIQNYFVQDVDTSSISGGAIDSIWDGVAHGGLATDDTVPFSRSGSGTALALTSSGTIDWLGRTRMSTDAGGMIVYTVYKDDETRVYPTWDTTGHTAGTPIQVTLMDKDGRTKESLLLKTSLTPNLNGSNEPIGTESYGNSDMASRAVMTYNEFGSISTVNRYHTMAVSGDGSRYTNYYVTETRYDSMGRPEYNIEDVADESTYDREQVTRHYYDYLGREIKTAEAVSDNSHDVSGDLSGFTVKKTAEYFYDDPNGDATPEQGDGDGDLRWVRKYYGDSSYNDTEYRYDWRNRRELTIPPLSPYTLVKHDNLDRVTVAATYSSTTNLDPGDDPGATEYASRLSLSKTYFDEWGRAYKSEEYDDPSASSPASPLASNIYYDRRGLVWASDPANTGITFSVFDGAGRTVQAFQGTQFDSSKFTGSAPDYPDDNEGIVQLVDYTLDSIGNATKIITKELNHDDTNGMNLSTSDYIRTYVYNYYDTAHRLIHTVNFGTNNSDSPTRWKDNSSAPTYDNDGAAGDQPPSRSDTALVTTYAYDSEGRQTTVTDPRAIITATTYDRLGRVTQKTEDYGGLARSTLYAYNGQGSLATITADLSTDQVTEYVYAHAQNSRWVTKIKYPATDTANSKSLGQPSDETYDRIVFTYNNDGTLNDRTDQNGTVLTWSYDAQRRKTSEVVTTLGTYSGGAAGVDGAVRAVTWTYDSEGRVQYLTTHTDTSPDTSTWTDASNQIKYTYNSAHKLTKEEQEVSGKVTGSTPSVQYTYGTEYSTKFYDRLNYTTYPDGRKIWNGYTNSGSSLQSTTNDVFNRVGQIAKDNSGSIGSLLAEYEFNGIGRQVRRVHDEDTGKYGNDTRMDLWHGTTGQYDGLDRFGRIVNLKHTDFSGAATDILQKKYTYDRDSNRLSIEDGIYKAESQSFTYDNLNRLTDAKKGRLNSSNVVYVSDVDEGYNMDLLGNLFVANGGGPLGVDVNGTQRVIVHGQTSYEPNAANELQRIDQPNAAGMATILNEPFTGASLNSFWSANKGGFSIVSNKANVDSLTSSDAVLLADPKLYMVTYQVAVTFPTSSSTNKAGIVFAHDGVNSYYAVVLNRSTGKIALYHISSGTWGSVLASANATINDSTAYTIHVTRRQGELVASLDGQSSANFTYTTSTDFGAGQSGFYSDKTSVTFDDLKIYDGSARDARAPRITGCASSSVSSGGLVVEGGITTSNGKGGEAVVQNFLDDYYVVETDVDFNSGRYADLWVRYADSNNGYRVRLDANTDGISLLKFVAGVSTTLGTAVYVGSTPIKVVLDKPSSTDRIRIWAGGSLAITVTDTSIPFGGVAFGGTSPKFDNVKIGYDNNSDDDIDDVGDDLVVNETFTNSYKAISYDYAGNLIDDGVFQYVYDAWNRLIKVRSSVGTARTFQTANFDGLGRRMKKVVTNSGDQDATVVYLYDGQKIIQANDGSGNMVQQFIHGTQYIDELVMVRVKDKGDLYVHQDANWNVIGLTDLGHHLVEHYKFTPYGELTVDQDTGFGDRDGDSIVNSTDKGTVGVTCTGTVSGACRILDLDFDGDYDSNDATKFDALESGFQKKPGKQSTGVSQPFAHQGLLFEPEIASYQNRARQYDPAKRRFAQRDPILGPPEVLMGDDFDNGFCNWLASKCESGDLKACNFATAGCGRRPPQPMIRYTAAVRRSDREHVYDYANSNPIIMVDPSGEGAFFGSLCDLGINIACSEYCKSSCQPGQICIPGDPNAPDRCEKRCHSSKAAVAVSTFCWLL